MLKTRKIVKKSETFIKPHQKLLGESRLEQDTGLYVTKSGAFLGLKGYIGLRVH